MELVPIEEIAPDATFRLREPGDVSELASAIGRLGQLTPVDLRPLPGDGNRLQVVCGFRRMEALRMLQRERVLARVHRPLDDVDAWGLALGSTLFEEPWAPADREGIAARVREHLPWAKLPAAPRAQAPAPASPAPAPTTLPPVGSPAFARALALRIHDLDRDVAAAHGAWAGLPAEGRRQILDQLRYLVQIFPFLEKENR